MIENQKNVKKVVFIFEQIPRILDEKKSDSELKIQCKINFIRFYLYFIGKAYENSHFCAIFLGFARRWKWIFWHFLIFRLGTHSPHFIGFFSHLFFTSIHRMNFFFVLICVIFAWWGRRGNMFLHPLFSLFKCYVHIWLIRKSLERLWLS